MKKNIIGFSLVIGLILIGLFWGYSSLGGFDPILVEKIDKPTIHLSGIRFKGQYDDPELKESFVRVKELSGEISEGSLVIINHEPQNYLAGYVHYFIGIAKSKPFTNIPSGFEVRHMMAQPGYEVTITAHNFVMPSPEKIKNKVLLKSDAAGLQIKNYTVEVYESSRSLKIFFPVE